LDLVPSTLKSCSLLAFLASVSEEISSLPLSGTQPTSYLLLSSSVTWIVLSLVLTVALATSPAASCCSKSA